MPQFDSVGGAAREAASRIGHAAAAVGIAGTQFANVAMTQPVMEIDPTDGTTHITTLADDPTTPASLVMESRLHDAVEEYSNDEKQRDDAMDQVEELADSFRFDELTPAEFRDKEQVFATDETAESEAPVGLFQGVDQAPDAEVVGGDQGIGGAEGGVF
jgi:hypothetical protein